MRLQAFSRSSYDGALLGRLGTGFCCGNRVRVSAQGQAVLSAAFRARGRLHASRRYALGFLGRVRAVSPCLGRLRTLAPVHHKRAHARRGFAVPCLHACCKARDAQGDVLRPSDHAAHRRVRRCGLFANQITYTVVIGYTNAGTATVLQCTGYRLRHGVHLLLRKKAAEGERACRSQCSPSRRRC